MAEKKQSKLRYDDFIANVQPDPGKPVATTLLSGFVGQGAEGHARIYPDPSLGTWYDVPEDAIVHSAPIADSKLGGSHIWVKADAQIKPGSAAAAAQPPANITPQPTPATHCFICPPNTQPPACPPTPANVCTIAPTPATLCLICPPHVTPATICTHLIHCPPNVTLPTLCTLPPACPPNVTPAHLCTIQPTPTPATHCFICPPHTLPCTMLCQADARMAAPAALPHTAATLCTQVGCAPQTFGPTRWCTWVGCPPHDVVGTFVPSNWCSIVGCNPATQGCTGNPCN